MKKQIVVVLSAAVLGTGVLFVTAKSVSAQSTEQPFQSIVTKIAQRFGLKESDVKQVFDEHHTERMAERQKDVEDKLTQLVKDGTITESQKTLILAKVKDMQATKQTEMDEFRSMTPEQRQTAMSKHKEELDAWAKTNGIDLTKLKGILGPMGKGHGFGKSLR